MTGGTTSVDDMIRSTQRGVPVTRLWYLREVDPRTILYTGLTRDGTFLIENGRIGKAVKNFRLWCPVFLLCFCASVFLWHAHGSLRPDRVYLTARPYPRETH